MNPYEMIRYHYKDSHRFICSSPHMHPDPILIQFVLIMLGTLVIARVAVPLSTAGIRATSYLSKVLVITAAAALPLCWLVLNPGQLAPATSAITPIVWALSLVWGLTILPTRSLAPSLKSPSEIHPTRSLKVIQLILCLVSLINPFAFVPCFALAYHQLRQRFTYIPVTELLLPGALSCLVVSYLCLSLIVPMHNESLIIALCACAGAHYVPSGIKKLRTGWIHRNALYNITVGASTQNRWDLIHPSSRLRPLMRTSTIPAQLTVVIIESLAIFAFVDFRVATLLLGSLIGILIAFAPIASSPLTTLDPLNTISLVLLACSIPFALPTIPTLAWFDSPVSRRVTFTLARNFEHATLNPYDIRPLDLTMSQSRQDPYFRDAPCSLECFGAAFNRPIYISLNKLSNDQTLSIQEKSTRALAILDALPRTTQSRWSINTESTRILHQLESNLAHHWAYEPPNSHIFNRLPRASRDQLVRLLNSDANTPLALRVDRHVYFYCACTNESIQIDHQSIEIPIINHQCLFEPQRKTIPTPDAVPA